jgi:hypothetical protein
MSVGRLALGAVLTIASVAIAVAPGVARAHPMVDDGTRAIERARFEEALAIFDRATRADDLSVDDLVRLLEGRALAHRAMGDEAAASADLERLAAIRPDHELARHVPPEIAQILRTVRSRRAGPLRAQLAVRRGRGRATVAVSLVNDPGGLVVRTRVAARVGSSGWIEGGERVEIEVPDGASVDVHVEVIALGGARVIEQGSRDVPLPLIIDLGGSVLGARDDVTGSPPTSVDPLPWVIAGGGVVVAAILAGVAIAIATSLPSDATALSPPRRVGADP